MTKIVINPKLITRRLVFVATLLIILSFASQLIAYRSGDHSILGLVQFLNLDAELNLPTFFSGLIMIFASLLLAIIYILSSIRKENDRIYWLIMSIGFLYMTFDEIFMMHERLIGPITRIIIGDNFTGILRFDWFIWVIPFGVIVVLLCFVFYNFLFRLPSYTRLMFIISGIIFVGGSIGLEFAEAFVDNKFGAGTLLNKFISNIQESMEMYGVILFIWSLLNYIAQYYKELNFRFET